MSSGADKMTASVRYLLVNVPDRVELYENRVVVRLKIGSKFLVRRRLPARMFSSRRRPSACRHSIHFGLAFVSVADTA